ncbi:MAG: hypothetical protein NTW16_12615 [Bacteroidetes bacterium]|nr:hypothetical protein [Bacteroidota bacterium]
MKNLSLFITMLAFTSNALFAQVGISTNNSAPDNSAMLDVQSTSKGALLPRMTQSQMIAIVNPANGLQVYCTTDNKMYIYVMPPGVWKEVAYGTGTITLPLIDARDGKIYNTVLIGNQLWMAQNLDIGTKISGITGQTDNSIIEKYCYNNIDENCNIYGGLYQWGEIVQYLNGASNTASWNPVPTSNVVGICPAGWHIPSYDEMTVLITFLGGESAAGGKMKETGLGHWASPNTGATNTSGLAMLGGGDRTNAGSFESLNISGNFWSASEFSPTYVVYRYLIYSSASIYPGNYYKTMGFSLRCVKD